MIGFAIFACFCIVGGVAWTYFLMRQATAPSDGWVREMREFNSHLLGSVGLMRQRENELLDRLFSAADGMQRSSELLLKQAIAIQASKVAQPGAGPPPYVASPPERGPRVTREDDFDDGPDDDIGDEVREAHKQADRRDELQEEGLLGVNGRDV